MDMRASGFDGIVKDIREESESACRTIADLYIKHHEQPGHALYSLNKYRRLCKWAARFSPEVRDGQHVVEIGYGHTGAMGEIFAQNGLHYYGVDPIDIHDVSHGVSDFLRQCWEGLDFRYSFPQHAPLFAKTIQEIPDQWADLVFSFATLEHIDDMPEMADEILRVTKPGGLSLHGLGTSNHRHDDREPPDRFLQYSEEEWPAVKAEYGWVNRLQAPAFRALFGNDHWEMLEFFTQPYGGLDEGAVRLTARKRKE
jgi:SAM-dependent methyltransferase